MRRVLIALISAFVLATAPAFADGGSNGGGVARFNGLTGDVHATAGTLGALACSGSCVQWPAFLAQLVAVNTTASAIGVRTGISDAPNGADYLELQSGTITAGGPLATTIKRLYPSVQMDALFANAGAAVSAGGMPTTFPPITTYLDTLIPVTSATVSVSGGTPTFLLGANNLSDITNSATARANLGIVTGTTAGTFASGDNSGRSFVPSLSYSALEAGYRQMERNLDASWWDSVNSHFVPTDGSGGANFGLYDGSSPSLWQMATLEGVYYWRWKARGDQIARTKIANQWAYIRTVFTDAQLSNAVGSGGVFSSDDADLKARYLMHVHEVTGDEHALTDLAELIPAVTQQFKDPMQSQVSYGTSPAGVAFSMGSHGLLYCAATDYVCTQNYGYVSESFDAMLGIAALYVYQQRGYPFYRQFAVDVYNHVYNDMITPAPADASRKAQYLIETYFNLDPNVAAANATCSGGIVGTTLTCSASASFVPNQYVVALNGSGGNSGAVLAGTKIVSGSGTTYTVNLSQNSGSVTINASLAVRGIGDSAQVYLSPQNAYFGKPVRSIDSTYMLGSAAEMVLGALLYKDGGVSSYLTQVSAMAAAWVQSNGYLRTLSGQSVLCNCRDPFSDGDLAQDLVWHALTLTGVDLSGMLKAAIVNTASAIFANGLHGTLYDGDWTGVEVWNGFATWQAAYAASTGAQAGYQQIMTNGSTAAMAQAGSMINDWSRRR